MKLEILLFLAFLLQTVFSTEDVVVCGGFIKSSAALRFSAVRVGVYSAEGVLKESTECAPHNGYFLLPIYSHGRVSISVIPPQGWTFSPQQITLDIDGVSDSCSKGEDLNFNFNGFTVSGRVLSKGLDVGPTGVSATLTDSSGNSQHVKTVDGHFSVPNVLSGIYTISFSHSSWKLENPTMEIAVQDENHVIEEAFVVMTYDVSGSVFSSGQPIAGVEVYLSSESEEPIQDVEGCEAVSPGVCKVVSDSNGVYRFPALTPSSYKVVSYYTSEHSRFDVSPNELIFTVDRDSVVIDTAFTVNGFAVQGRVLDAQEGGSPLASATIYVNGDKVSTTNSEGVFELSNVTSGEYEVQAKLKGYYFAVQTLNISPNTPVLPDISASAYQLCGKMQMDAPPAAAMPLGRRKVGLQPSVEGSNAGTNEGSNAALVTTVTDGNGAFCFKVSPGSYTVQSLIGADEHKAGLRLFPETTKVEITNRPVYGLEFAQQLSSVSGVIECIAGQCDGVVVSVKREDGQQYTAETHATTWTVPELLPGQYEVSVEFARWCWKETQHSVVVEGASQAPSFVQSGYIMKVQVSHAALLNFSLKEESEETIGSFSLEVGTNRFCLKKPGVYDLVPYSCNRFEQEVYQYDTSQSTELVLTAVEHLLTGEIRVTGDEKSVQVVVTNLETHDKVTLDTTEEEKEEEKGVTVLKFQMWSPSGQKYSVKPISDSLLFSPPTQTAVISYAECPTTVSPFMGMPGTFVNGKITPAVQGVLIKLTSPDDPDVKQTQISDEHGRYSIGPLRNNLQYTVTAVKDDYDLLATEGASYDFTAVKLSKLTVSIKEGEASLPGVLVSVSGTKGYRNNVVLEDLPLVLTGLVPGEYFIRPIMKEYKFTPSSKMLTVSEGLEVEVELTAERIAYSCYGRVTTLNGKAQPGVVVEAVGAGECSLSEEGTTGAEGEFRIRGLPPGCPITVSVRSDKSAGIRRASPPSRLVQGEKSDSGDVNFVVFHEPTTFDITGSVDVPEEYIATTKVLLVEESAGKVVHTLPLDTSRIFIFPDVNINKQYAVKLESSLSPSMYNFKAPDVKIKSEGPFQHSDIVFQPIRKSLPQEQVTRASFTALAVIVLSMVLAANHATLLPVFVQVFHSVTNRNSAELTTGETNGMEYIDDIHRGIRKKTKKAR